MNNIINEAQRCTAALLESLITLITALDEAELHHEDLPLALPGLLEQFLDPAVQAALPTGLRGAADAYLNSLPGYQSGDLQRAALQHALRLSLWEGEALPITEADIEALGLEEDDGATTR